MKELRNDASPDRVVGFEGSGDIGPRIAPDAGQQFVDDDAERVPVAFRTRRDAHFDFRRHVAERTHQRFLAVLHPDQRLHRIDHRVSAAFGIEDLGNAEIGENGVSVGTDHNVLEFEIAMDDTLGVDVGESFADVVVPASDRLLVRLAVLHVTERLHFAVGVGHEIHHEIRLAARGVRPDVGDLHDPRVVQLREQLPFRLEPRAHIRILARIGEQFQRMPRPDRDLLDLVHFAHPALPERPYHLIAADIHI